MVDPLWTYNISEVMEIQLAIVLLIAFLVLGPERMMDLAVKLGEMMRKVRETWDEVRMQAYMEEINKKVMESQSEDETGEDYNEDLVGKEEGTEDERGERATADDAPDGTSQGAKNKTD